jgi:hypothetical protein
MKTKHQSKKHKSKSKNHRSKSLKKIKTQS